MTENNLNDVESQPGPHSGQCRQEKHAQCTKQVQFNSSVIVSIGAYTQKPPAISNEAKEAPFEANCQRHCPLGKFQILQLCLFVWRQKHTKGVYLDSKRQHRGPYVTWSKIL
jgi:hypothetical protein